MRILLFGATGQVGREIARQAKAVIPPRDKADLRSPESCARAIRSLQADAIVNAAAYTAVDQAETEPDVAMTVNARAPAAMAEAAAEIDIPFIHISTDYVFDGSGARAWRETDTPAPLNTYGRTKLAGEAGVRAAGGRAAILRTARVFSAQGRNFVRTMLDLSQDRAEIDVVADQVGCPTPAAAVAHAAIEVAGALARGHAGGTWHFAGQPPTSWADFARAIFALAGRETRVRDVPSSAFPTRARRPANSRLDCTLIARELGISPPDWRAALPDVLHELGAAA